MPDKLDLILQKLEKLDHLEARIGKLEGTQAPLEVAPALEVSEIANPRIALYWDMDRDTTALGGARSGNYLLSSFPRWEAISIPSEPVWEYPEQGKHLDMMQWGRSPDATGVALLTPEQATRAKLRALDRGARKLILDADLMLGVDLKLFEAACAFSESLRERVARNVIQTFGPVEAPGNLITHYPQDLWQRFIELSGSISQLEAFRSDMTDPQLYRLCDERIEALREAKDMLQSRVA